MYPNANVIHASADLPSGDVALAAAWARSEYNTDEGLAMDDPGVPFYLGILGTGPGRETDFASSATAAGNAHLAVGASATGTSRRLTTGRESPSASLGALSKGTLDSEVTGWLASCTGACAFDAELVAAMQDLLYGACMLPGRLLRLAPGMAWPLALGGDRRVPLVFVPSRCCHAGRLW